MFSSLPLVPVSAEVSSLTIRSYSATPGSAEKSDISLFIKMAPHVPAAIKAALNSTLL